MHSLESQSSQTSFALVFCGHRCMPAIWEGWPRTKNSDIYSQVLGVNHRLAIEPALRQSSVANGLGLYIFQPLKSTNSNYCTGSPGYPAVISHHEWNQSLIVSPFCTACLGRYHTRFLLLVVALVEARYEISLPLGSACRLTFTICHHLVRRR